MPDTMELVADPMRREILRRIWETELPVNSLVAAFDLTQETDIDASPELVFRFFTDAELLARWLCVRAETDPRTGGSFTLNVTGTHVTRGTFRELGRAGPPAGLHVAIRSRPAADADDRGGTLTPVGRGTRVRLRHCGFMDRTLRDRHADGWEHYLPRLAAASSGADPGPDAWRADGAEATVAPGSPHAGYIRKS